jgi:N-acetyl-1-D-myo-inositol-2-amino-2-deoxy-alpha-D-glucopyranoside deacetylase
MSRLLVTVAHPDDEAFGCGSVLAHAAARGMDSVVACATRGERGEMAPGLMHGHPGQREMGRLREVELRTAAAILGVDRVELLGWVDSGMEGEPAEDSLAAADPAEVEDALAAVIEDVRPDVVVTLDASDGHRDHAAVRDATLAAVERTSWRPARVYLWCLPRSLLAEFSGVPTLGTPDDELTTVVDVSAHLEQRWRAMRAHCSQVPPYDSMSPDLARAFLATDHLRRVSPPWSGSDVERDWVPVPAVRSGSTR